MEETEKKACIKVSIRALFAEAKELGIDTLGMTAEDVHKAVEEAKNNLQ